MRYVALIRGINLGGKTVMKMSDLKAEFERLGFRNVTTYINSGNLAFDTNRTAEGKLTDKIEEAVEKRFGRAFSVILREQKDIEGLIADNPFEGRYESHKQMHVLFIREEVSRAKQDEVLSLQTDEECLAFRGRDLYALLIGGMAESILGRGLVERTLKVPVTARNWRTVQKLLNL